MSGVGASSTKLQPEEEGSLSPPPPSLNRISLGPSATSGLATEKREEGEALELPPPPPPLGMGRPGTAASSAARGEERDEEEESERPLTSSNSAPFSPEPDTPPIPFPVALRAASLSVHSALNSASLLAPSGSTASASASARANFLRAKGRDPRRGARDQSSASSPTAWPGAETATPSSPSVWVTLNSRREQQAGEVEVEGEEETSSPLSPPSSSVVEVEEVEEVELTSSGFPLPPLLSGRPEGWTPAYLPRAHLTSTREASARALEAASAFEVEGEEEGEASPSSGSRRRAAASSSGDAPSTSPFRVPREQAAVVLFVDFLAAAFPFTPFEEPPDVDLARREAHRRLEKVGGGCC